DVLGDVAAVYNQIPGAMERKPNSASIGGGSASGAKNGSLKIDDDGIVAQYDTLPDDSWKQASAALSASLDTTLSNSGKNNIIISNSNAERESDKREEII